MQQIESLKPMKYHIYTRDDGVEYTIVQTNSRAKACNAYHALIRQHCYARMAVDGRELPIFKADELVRKFRDRNHQRSTRELPSAQHTDRHCWST